MAKTSQTTVDRIERNDFKRMPSALPRIAQAIGLQLSEIDPTLSGVDTVVIPDRLRPAGRPMELRTIAELPVYATAEAGEGAIIVTNEPIDWVSKPDHLASVKDAYAVLLTGDSMIPRYWPGEILHIHPHLPPRREDGVILYPEAKDRAVVKEFVSSKGGVWTLKRYHPRQTEFDLQKRDWPVCHVIVGTASRR